MARLTSMEAAERMIEGGAEYITMDEFRRRAKELGYKISRCAEHKGIVTVMKTCSKNNVFNIGDSWPEATYNATHIESRLDYAHIDAPRDTLHEFQELIKNTVVEYNGYIHCV